ncbi:phage tail protein [Marinomonas sp. THO17]|uniref:phage tail protein n=1 Tax=Marinomonas sp. THO17 TaxID=3149048 RepID=UPI00336BBF3A
MEKMTQLANYLASQDLFSSDQLSNWMEEVTLKIGAKDEGDRVLLYRMQYRAVLLIESYDYNANSLETFHAYVAIWLAENDTRSDLSSPHPNVAIDLLSDREADLELTLSFEEDIYISRSDQGSLTYQNENWSLQKSDYDVAESATVEASVADESSA